MSEQAIMIIEDDEVAAEIIQKMIHAKVPDARIEWCWNGFEALVRIKHFQPDLIFLDYMMPKIDGLRFLQDLRRLENGIAPVVAIVSAYVDFHNRRDFLKIGAKYVVGKPVMGEQIHRILDEVFGLPTAASAGA